MSKLRYVGDGGFIVGIPARDLTDADLEALPKGIGPKTLIGSGLYADAKSEAKAADKSAESEKE